MSMINFLSFSGYVTMISNFPSTPNGEDAGCYKLISVNNDSNQQVNFVVAPDTYFVDHAMVKVGDWITGYYDGNVPVPLIYPPQYHAIVIVKERPSRHVKVDFFDANLLSSDRQLQLNVAPSTHILLTNGQAFTHSPANRSLIVIYRFLTRSIPPQTTPEKLIVLC